MGLVGAVMIARWTGSLLSETGRILLDRGDHAQLEGKIRTAMEGDGDTKVVDLHLWQVGQEKYACVLSVVAARPPPLSAYKDRLQDFAELAHVTVEVNPCAECAK
jgi:Co/Zn/Cd efflux system component